MKKLIVSGIEFVKENPRILYSIVLLVFLPAAFFLNTYGIISRMEKDIDHITQQKAVLAERIMNVLVVEKIHDQAALNQALAAITHDGDEAFSVALLVPDGESGRFRIVASSDAGSVGQTLDTVQYTLAWNQADGIAFLDSDSGGRFWRVTRQLSDTVSGAKIGLITVALPLSDSDALINKTVNQSYIILIVTIAIVLLMISNQARLFGTVLTLNKLKEVDAMKDTFVAMASHELRAPLTAIKGYLEFLEEKHLDIDDESKQYLHNITLSVNRLGTLVEDMLEVSRLEGNRVPFVMTDVNPYPLAEQSVEELRSQAIQKGLELTLLPVDTPFSVRADVERLKQIIVNLIGNALKYTVQGKVEVSMQVKDGQGLITVADTGIGISAEDQKKLFQKFSRIRNEQTQMITGTGLGLWITAELARKMNGSLTVESIEGVGSHFTLHIPLSG